jgi:adenylate cyclase
MLRVPEPSIRQVRLVAGLALFTYVTTHFLNHSLANISVAAAESGLIIQKQIWQTLPGAIILYVALATHFCLGLWALYERRNFRFSRAEATQLVLGLCIPALIADHVLGTRVSLSLFDTQKGYAEEFLKFWVRSPTFGVLQAVLLLVAWIHGCLGIHFWLRLKPFYPRVKGVLLSVAVLLPATALLGYYQGGQTILLAFNDPAWQAQHLTPDHVGTAEQNEALVSYRTWFFVFLAAAFGLIFLARWLRQLRERWVGLVTLTYPNRSVRVPRGLSVLETSLRYNIPHAHVCGGRGRCSTCRIRVLGRHDELPPASDAEQAVLARVQGGTGVRLACQLRPLGDISFVPLLPPQATVANAYKINQPKVGDERYMVIMFVDMRDSTRMAECRLPFDTVFVINRFLAAVGSGIVQAGGALNQIQGDGVLALFGLQCDAAEACRQAVTACGIIASNVHHLNNLLAHDLPDPVRFGIGIHAGTAIAGDIGFEQYVTFTVIGDPVNVAARLQDLTKRYGCEVLISEEVYKQAGFGPDDLPQHDVEARGRISGVRARSSSGTQLAFLSRPSTSSESESQMLGRSAAGDIPAGRVNQHAAMRRRRSTRNVLATLFLVGAAVVVGTAALGGWWWFATSRSMPTVTQRPQIPIIPPETICARDTVRLARLRADPSIDEIARFERELGCEQLRPQLRRLQESVGQ